MMTSTTFTRTFLSSLLGVGLICTGFALRGNAQVQTQTSVQTGLPTQRVVVRSGEVVYVSGNEVVVKGDDGMIRDFPYVPESARVTVNGQQLSVHDLVPGMTIERTAITTTTPKVITTVKTVTGTVWEVTPPVSVILTLEDGTNQEFKIPAGTKFTIDGQPTDAFSLRPGMKVSATAVTEAPEQEVSRQVAMTGKMPPFDPHLALLIIMASTETATNTAETTPPAPPTGTDTPPETTPAPTQLPQTGSVWPLVGFAGAFFCLLGLGLKARRLLSSR